MSQGLSVQAQAALAHRLQSGGVNGLNGGMHSDRSWLLMHAVYPFMRPLHSDLMTLE